MLRNSPTFKKGVLQGALFYFSTLLAAALSVACGHPATAPANAQAKAVILAQDCRLATVWADALDQARYLEAAQEAAADALTRAGCGLVIAAASAEGAAEGEGGSTGPAFILKLRRVSVEVPYENIGMPAPGTTRTPTVKARPEAIIEATLIDPEGRAHEVSGQYHGAFNASEPDAYREIALRGAVEALGRRVENAARRYLQRNAAGKP